MKSRVAAVRADGGLDSVDRAVQLLEDEWQRHGEVQLEGFWARETRPGPRESTEALAVLAELVKADLRHRFELGQTPTTAGYLERFPELRTTHSRVLSLVYEEYCLNEEHGTAPDLESFCDRYPEWKSSLASQLGYHRLFSQAMGGRPSLPCFPEAGQDFEEFRLQRLLGTGGTSRVFLARDLSLGGKQVALKVTHDRGQEPQVQGSLDHPHIVPVNSVVYQTDGKLCGLSMPYRPGLPLDEVIARVEPAKRPKKAIALWQALASGTHDPSSPLGQGGPDAAAETRAAEIPAGPRGDGWDGFPIRGTYGQGVAWIVMILARALHYAHLKHTFHRDVKPGNVLLTLRFGPQLLDFNLAESPHSADRARAALHGGTLPYMAPEQIEAFINPDLWDKVGARADVYSLGLVLRELLTGQKAELPDPGLTPARALRAVLDRRPFVDVAVRRANPAIPRALEAIVARCLAFAPDDRYPDAQALEHDLDRFLRYRPLERFANPSRRERLGNWLMRHRRVLSSAACTIVLGALLYSSWHARPPANLPKGPKIEASPDFQAAVRFVKDGDYKRAEDNLRRLEKVYRQSCLVKFYLCFALNADGKQESAANDYLLSALAVPDAESTLIDWAQGHREVSDLLVDFADSRIRFADEFVERWDRANPRSSEAVHDEERDREFRRPRYELASKALLLAELLLAEKLEGTSWKCRLLLAKTEQIFGNYEAAYDRLTRLISEIASSGTPDSDMSYFCRTLRGRVAFEWAEHQRRSGPTAGEQTLRRLQDGGKDLELCASILNQWSFDEDQKTKVYHSLHDRLRATVTLAEVETDLGRVDEAAKSFRRAERLRVQLVGNIEANKLTGKVPPPTDLEQRLDVGQRRLQGQDIAKGPPANPSRGHPNNSGSGG